MARERTYRYEMGFLVNGMPVPDPSSFTGAESDLDTLGKRDATGALRRNKVAMKCHLKLEWQNIEWKMVREIGNLMNKSDRFLFSYVDPICGAQTITAYAGDRDWEATLCIAEDAENYIGTLKVSVIEI